MRLDRRRDIRHRPRNSGSRKSALPASSRSGLPPVSRTLCVGMDLLWAPQITRTRCVKIQEAGLQSYIRPVVQADMPAGPDGFG